MLWKLVLYIILDMMVRMWFRKKMEGVPFGSINRTIDSSNHFHVKK